MSKPKSDVVLIRDYFKCSLAEIKQLTTDDRRELGESIRSLTTTVNEEKADD